MTAPPPGSAGSPAESPNQWFINANLSQKAPKTIPGRAMKLPKPSPGGDIRDARNGVETGVIRAGGIWAYNRMSYVGPVIGANTLKLRYYEKSIRHQTYFVILTICRWM